MCRASRSSARWGYNGGLEQPAHGAGCFASRPIIRQVKWVTWDQAAIAALVSVAITFVARRRPTTPTTLFVRSAGREFAFLAGVYSIWRIARVLPLVHDEGAIERARSINRWQQAVHMPSEIGLQQFVVQHELLARVTNSYYALVHVPSLIAFLVWLFVLHRTHFRRWRTGLVFLTAWCLVIRFIRVAPPRFVSELGFVDLSARYGLDVYGPVGSGVSDQFAAMPSIHVGWAAVVGLGLFAVSPKWPVRALGLFHLGFTTFVVAATGHHWWLDGIVAIVLLAVGLGINDAARAYAARRRSTTPTASPSSEDPELVTELEPV